jgi:chemotaxis-related protein WspD
MTAPRSCWREIGVWGDRSCPELDQHVHCSNCPVFAGEAQALLDRPVDPAYLAWLTDTVATRVEAAAPPDRMVLVFRAGGERFAIDASAVRVVAPVGTIRRLPHRDDPALLGLVAVRGDLMPCISLAALLGIEPETTGPAGGPATGLLVVLAERDGVSALLVDAAEGVEGIRREEMRRPPDTIARTVAPVTEGLQAIGEGDVTLLDRELLALRLLTVLD